MEIIIQRIVNLEQDGKKYGKGLIVFITGNLETGERLGKRLRELKLWNDWKETVMEGDVWFVVKEEATAEELLEAEELRKYGEVIRGKGVKYTNDGPCTFLLRV